MKKIILLTICALSFTIAQAQEISLLTFAGYSFASKFSYSTGNGRVNDGLQWGGGLEFKMNQGKAIEIIYQYMNAGGYVNDISFFPKGSRTGTAGIGYIMIGGTHYQPLSNDKVSLFGSVDVGAAVLNPDTSSDIGTLTKFAWGLRGGVKIAASEKISLRLHAQLLSPVQSFGLGMYAGTGGAGVGASTYSTIYQFSLGGSLNFRLK